jgi:hypothetical protein
MTTARSEPLIDESSAEEVIERTEDVSPFAGDAQGLEALLRSLMATTGEAALDAALRPIMPRRGAMRLALTFDGAHALVPYLLGPAAMNRATVAARVREWAGARSMTVRSATGAQIARGEAAGSYHPEMRRIGSLLREGVRFYRVEMAFDGGTITSESWVYAGARWMYVPEPWRFAEGSPARGEVSPTIQGAMGIPAGGLR